MLTKLKGYLLLLPAIIFEAIALYSLKAISNIYLANFTMIVLILISYIFLALCLKYIALSVAYSIWEIAGLILIFLISIFIFHEHMSFKEIVGVSLGFIGIVLVIAGEKH
ncbi:hypothetical protein BKH43_02005 [Helicobacter sp. 13S00401-1]|uniref:SMR family transporter n=1 Tax=Helicobacter sp. 13S00401-1 TaxID=1905758 RepID=UPI000BA59BA5|nr:SMR family transporter [Helicobacter sp. 13S00401-1]PAF51437.1 hypothetical protein BKH43_02005 [Helicobacter sp. 13S00401-1]